MNYGTTVVVAEALGSGSLAVCEHARRRPILSDGRAQRSAGADRVSGPWPATPGALLGESGMGKSLVLRVAAGQLERQSRAVVLVDALGATTREFMWQVACGLGTTPREDGETPWLWRQIADRVAENRAQQIDSVLLINDAGQAGPDLVTQFVRFARLDVTPAARWTMVLAAEPAQASRWNETLRNLVDLRIDIGPWTAEDTVGYVQTALVEAGRIEPLFEDAALTRLHELSGGVPRQVARLADYALLAGAAAGMETIEQRLVEAANEKSRGRRLRLRMNDRDPMVVTK